MQSNDLNELEVRNQYQIDITDRFAALESWDNDGDIHSRVQKFSDLIFLPISYQRHLPGRD
jgi:hypothetical protein